MKRFNILPLFTLVVLASEFALGSRLFAEGTRLSSGEYFVTQSWSQEKNYQRPYYVRVPDRADQKLPVFIFLHGNGGSAKGAMNGFMRTHTTMSARYVMVFAEGYQKSWNIVSERSKADDLGFIEEIVKKLATYENVQPNSFSIMGNSNGAALVNQLAIESRLPNIRNYVSAVSPLNVYQHDGKNFRAKGADNNYQDVAEPAVGRRLMNISGTKDELVPYHGGLSKRIPAKGGKLGFVDAEESIYLWARQMGTGGGKLDEPRREDNLAIFSYLDGDVVHYKVMGAGHNAGRAISEKRLLDFLEGSETRDPPKTDVFVSGRDGYHTYRIPSMVVTKKGTLLAICEGRRIGSADHGDVDLVLKRSDDNGETWSPMSRIWGHQGEDETTIGNPCAVVDEETGRIWLAMCRNQFEVLITSSDDDGLTWAEPKDITASVKNPAWEWPESIHTRFGKSVVWTGPGTGIQLTLGPHAGRLIIPCHMRPEGLPVDNNRMWVFYSDDHGANWKHSDNRALGNESQLVELSDGKLMLCGRNQNKKGGSPFHRLVSYSSDGGVTWSESSRDDELLEPICQASLLRYSWPQNGQKSRLLFSNPADKEERVRMTVRMSYDEGQTWPINRVIRPERCEYSCLTVLPSDMIGLLFKGDRRVMFTKFSLGWLESDKHGPP